MRVLLSLCLLLPWIAQAKTYCDDPESIADWTARVRAKPNDTEIQTLHALWLGLCAKVKEGSIERNAAIDLFEQERARSVMRRAQEIAEDSPLRGL